MCVCAYTSGAFVNDEDGELAHNVGLGARAIRASYEPFLTPAVALKDES